MPSPTQDRDTVLSELQKCVVNQAFIPDRLYPEPAAPLAQPMVDTYGVYASEAIILAAEDKHRLHEAHHATSKTPAHAASGLLQMLEVQNSQSSSGITVFALNGMPGLAAMLDGTGFHFENPIASPVVDQISDPITQLRFDKGLHIKHFVLVTNKTRTNSALVVATPLTEKFRLHNGIMPAGFTLTVMFRNGEHYRVHVADKSVYPTSVAHNNEFLGGFFGFLDHDVMHRGFDYCLDESPLSQEFVTHITRVKLYLLRLAQIQRFAI